MSANNTKRASAAIMKAVKGWGPLALAFTVLYGASFLPPDLALAEVNQAGRLRVCLPQSSPPLVTGQPDAPGFDVEVLGAIAERRGWRLDFARSAAMDESVNPRAWRVVRSQCQMLAGGVVYSAESRAFLAMGAPVSRSGWAVVGPDPQSLKAYAGEPVGVLVSGIGLSRVQLGQYLRGHGVISRPLGTYADLARGLAAGEFNVAVTELHAALRLADEHGLNVLPLDDAPQSLVYGYGFWRGDDTLRRAIEQELAALRADGTLNTLADRYNVAICAEGDVACSP